jgi:hypothetical protein
MGIKILALSGVFKKPGLSMGFVNVDKFTILGKGGKGKHF